jgi:nitrogen regulatory protein PII
MKAIFIPYNQSFKDDLIEVFDKMNIRGFTMWDSVQGRGDKTGEPHYGSHAWPTLNASILAVIPDDKVDDLLKKIHEMDVKTEKQGIHAFVWEVEKFV